MHTLRQTKTLHALVCWQNGNATGLCALPITQKTSLGPDTDTRHTALRFFCAPFFLWSRAWSRDGRAQQQQRASRSNDILLAWFGLQYFFIGKSCVFARCAMQYVGYASVYNVFLLVHGDCPHIQQQKKMVHCGKANGWIYWLSLKV